MPNVIRMLARIDLPAQIPQAQNKLEFELPTGYHLPWLSELYLLNPTTKQLINTNTDPDIFHSEAGSGADRWRWGLEIPVMSTPDGKLAIAAYAPHAQRYGFGSGVANPPWAAFVKWHIIYDLDNPQPGPFYFESFLIVGDLDTVKEKTLELAQKYPQFNMPPVGWLDTLAPEGDTINGWADDPNSDNVAVHIIMDGPSGTGKVIGAAETGLPRPDVNDTYHLGANTGFRFPIPVQYLDNKDHLVYAYAIDATPSGYPPQNAKLGLSGQHMIFRKPASLDPADINSDGKVDNLDLHLLIIDLGKTANFNAKADLNKDDRINILDLVNLAKNIRR
jgi:hypothetical protein